MSRLDLRGIPVLGGTGYPVPFHEAVAGRTRQALGAAGGLTQFGVNLVELQPGAASSQRHWHSCEDEFVTIISGELVLITDEGETIMRAGEHAAFPAGVADAHHLVNRSRERGVFLAVGSRNNADVVTYPDFDLRYEQASNAYLHTDGTPYPKRDA